MALERELETFRKVLPELLAWGNEGKYVLIHGDTVDSLWNSTEEGLTAGYERFGLDVFLVKKVTLHEKPIFMPSARRVRHLIH